MIYLVTNNNTIFPSNVYEIISVEKSLEILNTFPLIQYDSETLGLNPHINKILCIQFGSKQHDIQIVVDTLSIDILHYKNILESKYLITQNGKFDLQFLYSAGIFPTLIYDTMIVEQFLYLGYPSKGMYGGIGFGLNDIALRYLNITIDKSIREDIIRRKLDEEVIKYAADDVKWLEDIMEKQLSTCISRNAMIGAKLECDFVPVIAYLEWCGIALDKNIWENKMKEDQKKLIERTEALNQFIIPLHPKFSYVETQGDLFSGFDLTPKCLINWSSSRQVIEVAKFLGFNTNIQDKKTGEIKESVVEKHLKGQKGINDEFLKLYFAYQESAKLCSTYGQTYINAINPITGRIHTKFRQLGASSGRMSCGGGVKDVDYDLAKLKKLAPQECKYVQLQTLPSDHTTRSAFIAGEDRVFCSADYSGLEARLGADIYQEESMIYEFLKGSGDIHSLVARACFSEIRHLSTKEIKEKHSDLRKRAKPVG